nr:YihY/virulence factor BrkB family protein [Oxobacter pfennigii]
MKWKTVLNKLYKNFMADEITALSAQVAYYLILSFFPFLIFTVTLISYTNLVDMEKLSILSEFIPGNVYGLIVDLINNIMETRNRAFISLGIIGTIWSASTGVLSFMYGMNRAYRRKETRPFLMVRALSILFTLALSLILILSIILVVFGEVLGRHILNFLSIPQSFNIIWDILRYIMALLTLLLVFIFFYLYIPNCKLTIKGVLPGSVLATAGWVILSAAFELYVNYFSNFSRTYGSIGTAVALLIWLYWNSIIIFIGSELNAILYNPDCRN